LLVEFIPKVHEFFQFLRMVLGKVLRFFQIVFEIEELELG